MVDLRDAYLAVNGRALTTRELHTHLAMWMAANCLELGPDADIYDMLREGFGNGWVREEDGIRRLRVRVPQPACEATSIGVLVGLCRKWFIQDAQCWWMMWFDPYVTLHNHTFRPAWQSGRLTLGAR